MLRLKHALFSAGLAGLVQGCGVTPEGLELGSTELELVVNPGATYTLVGVQSNKCVRIRDSSTSDRAVAEIGACSGRASEQFRLEDVGGGYFRVRNVNSGKCLDVDSGSTTAGAGVIQWTCSTGANQQWLAVDVAAGAVQLVSRHSGQALDVSNARTVDGTPLVQWPSSGNSNQQFRVNSSGVCTAAYEAESMQKTTGGAIAGGWNIWTNGSVYTSHNFAAGANTLTVVAKGDQFQGAPRMVVTVAGQQVGAVDVPATGWTSYQFNYNAVSSGSREVRVSFANDAAGAGVGDRNLHVDKVSVQCGGGTGGGTGGTGGTGGGSACNATTTPVARHGQLRIEAGKLVNQCGRPVQFASMSMYDWSQQGRQFYNATAVRNLAGTGTGQKKNTTLRIPLLASNWPSQYPRLKTVLDACIANGIYCIPNWHVIGSSNVANAKAFYVQLARDYGNTPNIIYEPWNEPTTQSWSEIKAYMEEIMTAVRPIDPDGIFLAGTRQWGQRPDEACANPINRSNVGYVFHFYANSHSLAGFQRNIDACLTRNQMVWTTEYGGVSADGNGTFNVAEVNRWWDYMDRNLISSNNWAIETNTETSSVFTGNASATGPWPDSQITNSGRNVFAYIAERYPVTMSQ